MKTKPSAYDFFDFELWNRLFPGIVPPTPTELADADREMIARERRRQLRTA